MPRLTRKTRNRQGADGEDGGVLETLLVAGLVIAFVIVVVGLLYLALAK